MKGQSVLGKHVGKLFLDAAALYSRRCALIEGSQERTFKELRDDSLRCANGLRALGVEPGDRVAMWMHNSIQYVVTDLAISLIGAVKVPLNDLLSPQDVRVRLADADVRAAVVSDEYMALTRDIVRELDVDGRDIMLIATGERAGINSLANIISRSSGENHFDDTHWQVHPNDPVAIMYTGGTTGEPKGVVHTQKSLQSILYSQIVEFEISRRGKMLHVAPLPHAGGFMLLSGLLRGNTQVIERSFSPTEFVQRIEETGSTFSFLVPTMIYALLEEVPGERIAKSSLETILYGASTILPDRLRAAIEAWGPILIQAYSQMEVANQTTVLTKADHQLAISGREKLLSSCGRPVMIADVRVIQEDGRDVEPGDSGELVTRGPHLMAGYWHRPQETEKTVIDGWLHTGDVARLDDDGYMYIVDRLKDVIITGGMNVYSSEVESTLSSHPSVGQVAVVGVEHAYWGEAVHAVVVPAQPGRIERESLSDFCRERLPKYAVPKVFTVVEQLPLTAYGKVDKKELRARLDNAEGQE